ncbi:MULTISPECIES: cadmium resistance transporter [Actinomycetes]|uniref:Cadmium transporter n=1 Tax=Quadrisphaera setariae TaxID=2593304 RepID=A0A5C8Z507_9ACTN|nr:MULTISPECIES: cadmium resistance transporter [Actinomycetes]TNM60433.1 cadmium transporter [Streptomyces sp. NP160]TXR52424.1 cadmium transporter [Quadrisphaera setariae]
MTLAVSALQAVGLFLVTNIDDIIVLSLFFARGAGAPGTTFKITVGQYLGFGAILVTSILIALGAGAFLPEGVIPYFGLIPLLIGLRAAWQAWRNRDDDDDDDDDDPGRAVAIWSVAAVTFANGGDNIGVYVPVFLAVGPAAITAYVVVFLALVAVLVLAARYIATRRPIAEVLERWEHILFPLVLIVLGVVILVEGGAFGL